MVREMVPDTIFLPPFSSHFPLKLPALLGVSDAALPAFFCKVSTCYATRKPVQVESESGFFSKPSVTRSLRIQPIAAIIRICAGMGEHKLPQKLKCLGASFY